MYDVNLIRKDFPMLNEKKMQGKQLVFLDNSSTTFKPTYVIDAIDNYYMNETSNSHRGDYDLCYDMDVKIEKAREVISSFVNCDKNEVVFTNGTTSSINLIAWGYALKHLKKGDEIVLSVSEHASNLLPWFNVSKQTGAVIKYIDLDKNGRITIDNAKKVISKKTKIVSLAHISNVLGNIVDIKSIAKIVHQFNAIMVVDGAQSIPHLKTDFKDLDIDFLVFSAHKMYGPTGVGALIGKYHLLSDMEPVFSGGGMNVTFKENGDIEPLPAPAKFEAGTLNLAGIMGFKAAVEYIKNIGIDNIHQHECEIRRYAIEKMEKIDHVIIYNKYAEGSMITFNIDGIFAQDEATLLNYKGIAVRSGLHCAKILPSFLNVPATIRMSIALYTSKEEIDIFVDAIKEKGDILDAYFND